VILVHALAMEAIDLHEAHSALIVDLTMAHLAALIFGYANGDVAPILVTAVGAAVLIGLFSDGRRQISLFAFTAVMTTISLFATGKWDIPEVLGDALGALFVITLVSRVIAAVRRRVVELEAARAQTIGVVSHELRNHLTGVIAATEMMSDDENRLDQATLTELLDLAHNQAVEAGEVIEDLLTASRAERGVLDVTPEVVDVRPIVETTVRRFAIGQECISLDIPGDTVWALVDPLRYGQVVRNLLSNAVRYGGTEIRVSLEEIGGTVSLVVADNGPGVDPGEETAIFEAYHRAANTTPAPGSTGLGLWIARGLARRMKGDLVYRRQSGQTFFELTVPGAKAPAVDPWATKRLVNTV
jgi:signal transduction histidine kinase